MTTRRHVLQSALALGGASVTLMLPAGWIPRARGAVKWHIGFSQATTLEPWRVQFNKDLEAEAKKHPEAELLMADAQDRTEQQVADMENFIRREVDAILISPKESAGLTGVCEKAIDAKIPVFVLDRNINSDRYTQFIGGDNVVIGRAAGTYVIEALGGPGKAKGNVVEIWGGLGTQASHDRSNGFHEVSDKEGGIKYLLKQQSADWKQDKAYEVMATALRSSENIDLVYGHNDPMAYGAYLAAKDAGREKNIKFVGVDGLPNEGLKWVHDGILVATFLYPTPGAEGFRQALKLLNGEQIPKKIVLPTAIYTKANVDEILKANSLL
jgi:ribose transport system substrate-binding protein